MLRAIHHLCRAVIMCGVVLLVSLAQVGIASAASPPPAQRWAEPRVIATSSSDAGDEREADASLCSEQEDERDGEGREQEGGGEPEALFDALADPSLFPGYGPSSFPAGDIRAPALVHLDRPEPPPRS